MKEYAYLITMNDGTTERLTVTELCERFNISRERMKRRLERSLWRTEALLSQSAEAALHANRRKMRKILMGERVNY